MNWQLSNHVLHLNLETTLCWYRCDLDQCDVLRWIQSV